MFILQSTRDHSASDSSDDEDEASPSEHAIPEIFSRMCFSEKKKFHITKHSEKSLKAMKAYFNTKQLTDVVLIAGDKRISAHRLVLSAASDYFAAMFTGSMRESTQKEVELIDVDGDALSDLVKYCYTGWIEFQAKNVITLFETACLLQFNSLPEICCQYLLKELHPSNCLGIKIFFDSNGRVDSSNAAQDFALKNFSEVIKYREFLYLSAEEVAKLLKSEDLNVPSEKTVFHALMIWLRHDLKNRSDDAGELLNCVKLPLLSPAFIAEHIEGNKLFKSRRMAQDLIAEALMFHLLPKHMPALIQSGRAQPRKASEEVLLVLNDNHIKALHLENDKWKTLASWSVPIRLPTVTCVENQSLIVSSCSVKEFWKMESLTLSSSSWNQLPPTNSNGSSYGFAVLGGSLYAVGGYQAENTLKTTERWDPVTNKWNYCRDWTNWRYCKMLTQRYKPGVAVLNNKLYAVGGNDGRNDLKTVECYDPEMNKWTPCAPMSRPRLAPKIAVLNEYLYVLEGNDFRTNQYSMERYDYKTDTWLTLASVSLKYSSGIFALGNRLFVIDDSVDHMKRYPVNAYDPILDNWEKVSSLEKKGTCYAVIKRSFIQP